MTSPRGVTVIAAHRGGAGLWPENSMTAFRGALGLSVEQIETDIHLSSDGEPFILHDRTLDRTTEAGGIAAQLAWAELAQVRLKGTSADTVPHLDDLLALMAPTAMGLRLELKRNAGGDADPALLPRALASLERYAMTHRTTFTSFDQRYIAEVMARGAGAGCLWLVARDSLTSRGITGVLDSVQAAGIEEIGVHASQLTSELVSAALRRGLRLGFYAVNDVPAIASALDAQASAFTTDRPDLAVTERAGRDGNR